MASIQIKDYTIDINVFDIDGLLHTILNLPFQQGYWVFLTIQNQNKKKESFPFIDENLKVKIYKSYSEAIDDIAKVLKQYFSGT